MIPPQPVSGVVVEERLREADDRVGERGRIRGWLVRAGRDLRVDQLAHAFHGSRLDDARARGQQPHRPISLLLQEAAYRGGASEGTVDTVEHREQSHGPMAAHLASFPVDELLELVGDDLAQQGLTRAEPAVDRRAAQPKLARDHGQVDALTVEVLAPDRAQHISP
jgi:hypothetical protein